MRLRWASFAVTRAWYDGNNDLLDHVTVRAVEGESLSEQERTWGRQTLLCSINDGFVIVTVPAESVYEDAGRVLLVPNGTNTFIRVEGHEGCSGGCLGEHPEA